MKKILCCFLNPLFLLLCTIIPLNTYAVDDYEMPKNSGGTPTVTVIGTRGGGGGGGGVGPILGGGGGGRGAGGGGAGPGMSESQEAKAEAARKRECDRKTREINATKDTCIANASFLGAAKARECSSLTIGGSISGNVNIGVGGVSATITATYISGCRADVNNTMIATKDQCAADASNALAKEPSC